MAEIEKLVMIFLNHRFPVILLFTIMASSYSCVELQVGPRTACEPLTVSTCLGLNYNQTMFPNLLQQATQTDAAEDLDQYSLLITLLSSCSSNLRFFFCSIYFPLCHPRGALPPCRHLCEEVRDGCEQTLNNFGYQWPDLLSCARLPRLETGYCVVKPDERGLQPTLPPTALTPPYTGPNRSDQPVTEPATTSPPIPTVDCQGNFTWCDSSNDDAIKASLHASLTGYFYTGRQIDENNNPSRTKQRAMNYVVSQFSRMQNVVLDIQTFKLYNTLTGKHIIGILRGNRWGTNADEITLLGAHYDTVQRTMGVNDNGSGIAALLTVAKLLTQNCINGTLNSVLFVAFDLEEYGIESSKLFVEDYLIEKVLRPNGWPNFQGAIILDTLMNYDTTPNSQSFPPDLEEGFPSLYSTIAANDFRGDFLLTVFRSEADGQFSKLVQQNWLSNNQVYRPVPAPLPVDNLDVLQLYYGDFLRSDHANFWREYPQLSDHQRHLPAIFLTDTADYRGYMRQCYHRECDNITNALDSDNLDFLRATVKSLSNVMANIGHCAERNTGSVVQLHLGLMEFILLTILWRICHTVSAAQ